MESQTTQGIKTIFKEFSTIDDYHEKLVFFENNFGLLPFKFPSFQPGVDILMKEEEINSLIKIFEEERKMTAHYLVRSVMHLNKEYLFNIAPVYYNRQIFNEFVIEHFQSTDKGYTESIEKVRVLAEQSKCAIAVAVKEAKDLITLIGQKLKSQVERSLRHQFLNVFYNGYIDYQSTFIKQFPSKKKLIELYLYAQGILFAKYISTLEGIAISNEPGLIKNTDFTTTELADLEKKISLLNKNGIIDFLYNKPYTNLQVAEFIAKLFGQKVEIVETVIKGLKFNQLEQSNIPFKSQS